MSEGLRSREGVIRVSGALSGGAPRALRPHALTGALSEGVGADGLKVRFEGLLELLAGVVQAAHDGAEVSVGSGGDVLILHLLYLSEDDHLSVDLREGVEGLLIDAPDLLKLIADIRHNIVHLRVEAQAL